ncbi:hypothetical protein LL253_04015 [Sphingobium soli]|uniref:Uncharacterized protein n=1 Tax=Sphingobium soli TaxID=1591116 RepID=A0ABS8H000_9SPHN|nr:hypothetical protein [Sphingobium soli]MCC4231855.1 hypothetical protein [Sphingobium soli]
MPLRETDQAATCALRSAKRRRATSATAAAPKSRTIGGAGTSVPPVLVLDPPVELLVEELVDDELLVDDEVDELPVLPKLDELLDDEPDEPDEDDELLPDDPPVEPG